MNRPFDMTNFEKKVLRETLKIPLGETITYKELALRCGRPKAFRAVANALNKNPFTVLIPCHRVVASGNKLGGYSQGVAKKRRLLDLESKIKDFLK